MRINKHLSIGKELRERLDLGFVDHGMELQIYCNIDSVTCKSEVTSRPAKNSTKKPVNWDLSWERAIRPHMEFAVITDLER